VAGGSEGEGHRRSNETVGPFDMGNIWQQHGTFYLFSFQEK
jgi:hypothetical protein